MRVTKYFVALFFGLFLFSVFVSAQEKVRIFNAPNFDGANISLDGSQKKLGTFDRIVKSIQVPRGFRVTIYSKKDFKGTQAVLTSDWNPGAGAWWASRVRSIRIEGSAINPPPTGNFPVIYAQANYRGPAMAVERNWAGSNDWDGSPHRIRSIRVPTGWKLRLYAEKNFRGIETLITSNITWSPTAYWSGRVRSIRIENSPVTPPTPGNFPVIYAQANYQGPAMAVERNWAGSNDWDGSPHRIRSIRVPTGWKLRLYSAKNFRGIQTSITSNTSWSRISYWSGRVRSIKIEGSPGNQPSPGSFPVLYAGTNFDGPAEAIERDKSSLGDWDGSPHTIRSIRVPQGWYLMLYTKSRFRGTSYNVSSNITFAPGDQWYNKIRSIKVYKGKPPIQPR